jgi:hypothetical protein
MVFDYSRFVGELRDMLDRLQSPNRRGELPLRVIRDLMRRLEYELSSNPENVFLLRSLVDQILAVGREENLSAQLAAILGNSGFTDLGESGSLRGLYSKKKSSVKSGPRPPPPPEPARTKSSYMSPTPDPGTARQIRITGHSMAGEPVTTFLPKADYKLDFSVGAPSSGNLARGEIDVNDVPEGGLKPTWIVTSPDVEFLALSPSGKIIKIGDSWVAEFDLPIPGHGDSAIASLDIRTTEVAGHLMVTLLVGGEEYRKVYVALTPGGKVTSDFVCNAPQHLNLRAPSEWTTPPAHIAINVSGQTAHVSTIIGDDDYGTVGWQTNSADLRNPIENVRKALERFRVVAEDQLDDLDIEDMSIRLANEDWRPRPNGWHEANAGGEFAMTPTWASQLHDLANAGYRLFNSCFPEDSELRAIIERLDPGSRIDFIWTQRGSLNWVPHVPWALMYLKPIRSTETVDCELFLGLRYRIGSKSYEPKAPSRALGASDKVNALNFLYWGKEPNDDVAEQSKWQRSEFGKWNRQCFVPDGDTANPKDEVLAALDDPRPQPAGILYFYCHCSIGNGGSPVLQFGEVAKVSDIIEADNIYQGTLEDGPLVFVNACTSAAGNPLATSELEARFFKRHIRAFIGTETKVPIALASRFAWLFFQFFLRKIDGAPMPAGEALAQSRLFLWTQYHNIGGLFYCLVNGYDLYLASSEAVAQLPKFQRKK